MSVDTQHLRAIILKIQNVISDDDRQRLHFFLGNDVPRRFRDDSTLRGTLNMMESLFDQDKINESDFTFLINAFDEIHCNDAVKILREHMRKIQMNGQYESMQSVRSILLQDEEDKYANRNMNLINLNLLNNNTPTYHDVETDPNPIDDSMNEHFSVSSQTNLLKLMKKKMHFRVLFCLLLIIVFATMTCIYGIKIRKLNNLLEINNTNYNEKIQTLTNQLASYQQKISKWNKIRSFNIKQDAIAIAGEYGEGNQSNQFNHSFGIYVNDDDQTVYITDFNNHRIIEWKFSTKKTEIVVGRNEREYQLLAPTDVIVDQKNDSLIICDAGNRRVVRWSRQNRNNQQTLLRNIDCYGLAMDNDEYLYVSDYMKNEVRRWKMTEEVKDDGKIIAGGNHKGNSYNQLDRPGYIAVSNSHTVYVSDRNNHRVMKWIQDANQGIVVAGGNGEGNNLTQLAIPQALTVDKLGNVYVADLRNHRIMRWMVNAKEGRVIASGHGEGQDANQLLYPTGMSWDFEGNLYVADCSNNRVQKFNIDID